MGNSWCRSRHSKRVADAKVLTDMIAQLEQQQTEIKHCIERAKNLDPNAEKQYTSVKLLQKKLDLANKLIPYLRDKLIAVQSAPEFMTVVKKAVAVAEKHGTNTVTGTADALTDARDVLDELLAEEDAELSVPDLEAAVETTNSSPVSSALSTLPSVPSSRHTTTTARQPNAAELEQLLGFA
jgi:oligoendopeptidase F